MDIDLKSIIKELKNHNLPFEGLSGIDKQSFEKHNTHTISDFTLDGDPKDFYVKFVNFDERPQNTALLNQCKKLIERVFYPILDASTKYMDKNMSPIFDQNLTISSYKEAFSSFNFTELLYNPIEKAQSRDTTRGCELINKSNTHASFSSVVNSM
ncbi:hypothetical protein AX774_g6101 [Zancudomyces culisetae]|uniref:Uncharacterized protein n=1 Tax=Zancudomyces culisetae TaxID=1213189 RepID=A0A1R1PHS0_ZANCU|nr:hypothetical protein AX774_g6101 [Zancudomyces culisetae]|eukprot:OMH80463.1 hypothetical protein AX774_g6101 [Zancudomyces culisetae]